MSFPYKWQEPPKNWIGWNTLNDYWSRSEKFSSEKYSPEELNEIEELCTYIREFRSLSIPEAVKERACSSPDFVAVCVVIGAAFGDEWQDELIQLKDGSFIHSHWGSVSNQIEQQRRQDLKLTLRTELLNLRNEGYILRSDLQNGRNDNWELTTGKGLGRYGMIYVAVDTDVEWLNCERPMEGKYRNNAVNRIYQAVYGYLTLA